MILQVTESMEKGGKARQKHEGGRPPIWDCGSQLYDSFELKSFQRHLHSAISSRTLSMPHLSDRRIIPPPPPSQPQTSKKPSSKISRSLQKLLKSVFRPRNSTTDHPCHVREPSNDVFYAGALSEIPEYDRISPEIGPFVRRTASDRFKAAPVGISCAWSWI